MKEYPKFVEVNGKIVKLLDKKERQREALLKRLQKDKPKRKKRKDKIVDSK